MKKPLILILALSFLLLPGCEKKIQLNAEQTETQTALQTQTALCVDGTSSNSCSSERPQFCTSGTLIEKCSLCGCPAGKGCKNERCTTYLEIETPLSSKSHPWYHQTLLATSQDGENWVTNEKVIVDQASVPEIVQLKDGGVMLYYVDGTIDMLGCSSSTDGITWEKRNCLIEGMTTYKAYDPNVVKLEEGYRMFYFGREESFGSKHKILSAFSTDGINWVQEEGIRYEDYGVTDPFVIKMGNVWKMYLFMPEKGKLISAHSTDGLTFIKDNWTFTGASPSVLELSDGRYRLFSCDEGMIVSAISNDGTNWSSEGTVIPVLSGYFLCDPSPTLLEDGTYLMTYKRQPT